MRLKRLNDKDDTETGHEGIKSQGTPCYSNRVERFKHPLKGEEGLGVVNVKSFIELKL